MIYTYLYNQAKINVQVLSIFVTLNLVPVNSVGFNNGDTASGNENRNDGKYM